MRADLDAICVGSKVYDGGMSVSPDAEIQPVFFCNMTGVRVREILEHGDGGELPDRATVKGLRVAQRGFINIINALVSSNGVFSVIVDEKSEVVPYDGE